MATGTEEQSALSEVRSQISQAIDSVDGDEVAAVESVVEWLSSLTGRNLRETRDALVLHAVEDLVRQRLDAIRLRVEKRNCRVEDLRAMMPEAFAQATGEAPAEAPAPSRGRRKKTDHGESYEALFADPSVVYGGTPSMAFCEDWRHGFPRWCRANGHEFIHWEVRARAIVEALGNADLVVTFEADWHPGGRVDYVRRRRTAAYINETIMQGIRLHAATLRLPLTSELLSQTFRIDGCEVRHGEATAEQHRRKVAELAVHAAGTSETAARHQKMADEIERRNVHCLDDLASSGISTL